MNRVEYQTKKERGERLTRIVAQKILIPTKQRKMLFSSTAAPADKSSTPEFGSDHERPSAPSQQRMSAIYNGR